MLWKKMILFTIFLLVYLIILLANLGMITLIRMDPQMHTPMYFVLSHLSFSDLSISTAVGPKMLVDLFAKNKSIPFYGCALQLLVLYTFIDCECLLLAVMAYDRYKAVSSHLLYAVSMSSRVCSLLMAGVYLVSIAETLIHTTLASHLCFCGSNEINHFFCDVAPLLLLSCSDTQVNELLIFTAFGFIELSTISGVLVSYCYIILLALKIHSSKGGVQSFLYLHLSSNFCGSFPGNNALHVFQAEFFLFSRSRQNDLFVLHPCDSHVKPSDL